MTHAQLVLLSAGMTAGVALTLLVLIVREIVLSTMLLRKLNADQD